MGERRPRVRTANTSIADAVDIRAATPPPKTPDPYYQTPEHREWSRAVLAAAHGVCAECGREGARLYADHIVEVRDIELGLAPRSLLTAPRNGTALCGACHGRKTARERERRLGR